MNHSQGECKDAIGTETHALFPQVFIPPFVLYFSVATGFPCFVTATEFKLEDLLLGWVHTCNVTAYRNTVL
jgi:hypothetical protein